MKRRGLGILLSVVLVSVGAWFAAFAATPADMLVVGVIEEVTTMDPAIDYTFGSGPLFRAAYERLVNFDSGVGQVVPELATSWDVSVDGLTYTFHLRSGVVFHDGAAFGASAVKKAYDRVVTINEGPAWLLKDYVREIKVVDEATVQLVLKRPFSPFLKVLSSYWAMCIPSPKAIDEHAAGADMGKDWFRNHMVGTGAYRLAEWVEGQQIVFDRYESYWRGQNAKSAAHIVFRKFSDPTTMSLSLEKGDLDIAYGIALDQAANLKTKAGVVVEVHNTFTTNMIAMNTQKGPLSDVRVRRAVSYAFDSTSAMAVFGGYATPLVGQVPEGLPGHDGTLPAYHYDLALAQDLLEQTSYSKGFELEYTWVTEEPEGRGVGILLQKSLKQLGITLKITEVTVAGHWARISDPATTPDLANYRWGIDYPDALSVLIPLYHGDYPPGVGYNISRLSDPRVNDLLGSIQQESDDAARNSMLREVQGLINDDASNIWITAVPIMVALRSNVHGYLFEPANFSSFNVHDITKD